MEQKPNFYAIIPAFIRYDESLSSSEKLFYAEITAMSNREGFCWASNKYFADLFKKSPKTISAWVSNLAKLGHLEVVIVKEANQVIGRKIYPLLKNKGGYPEKSGEGYPEKDGGGILKNTEYNITSTNTTSINKPPSQKKSEGLFGNEPNPNKKTLFANSPVNNSEVWTKKMKEQVALGVDVEYYRQTVADWSDSSNTKRTPRGWLATGRQFMRGDHEKGKLKMVAGKAKVEDDALEYLKM